MNATRAVRRLKVMEGDDQAVSLAGDASSRRTG